MCTRPIEMNGLTFACRTCEACLETRRAQWVARMMMERASHARALSITLTYDEETGDNRDAAMMFCYADVQAFMRRLRQSARRAGQKSGIRFVVAGEQGDRNGRCHWHIVLYSEVDLRQLGEVTRWGRRITDPKAMMTVRGGPKIRCHWSLWGKGFVTFQKADLGEMRYVAWYVVMDQYTDEKSKGTAREADVINFATGLFRMSKRPPIGHRYLVQKMEALDRKGAVLPTLHLQVPGMTGFYEPSGAFRRRALWHLRALNQRALWATGEDAPQWAALLSNLSYSDADRRVLDGTPQTEDGDDDADDLGAEIVARSAPVGAEYRTRERYRCGREYPCRSCLDAYQVGDLEEIGIERREEGHEVWQYYLRDTGENVARLRTRPGSQPNRYCIRRTTDAEGLRLAFPLFDPART